MEKIITFENIRNFAYCNDRICKVPIRGMVVDFFGLGGMSMYAEETRDGTFFAEKGILLLVPYNNPWAWMNAQAVAYTDELIGVVKAHFGLGKIPLVSVGGSMGGLSALVYTRYSAHGVSACVANCPVCDLPYHFTERPDLPRTLYSAFWNEEGTLQNAMEKRSPLHLAQEMPRVPYVLFHCDADKAVNIDMHSRKFVAAMREAGQNISFTVVPDRDHCDLTEEAKEAYFDTIARFAMGE